MIDSLLPVITALVIAGVGFFLLKDRKTNSTKDCGAGISFIDVYIPSAAVLSSEDNGNCTNEVAVISDREDVCSMAMTVVSSLLRKSRIDKSKIGYVIIVTSSEVPVAEHYSISSSLVTEFFSSETEINIVRNGSSMGVTSALFDAARWVNAQSTTSSKVAIVVATDVIPMNRLPYSSPGCGSSAVLVARDAPIALDTSTKTIHRADNTSINHTDIVKEAFKLFRDRWNRVEIESSLTGFERIEKIVTSATNISSLSNILDAVTDADACEMSSKILFGSKEQWEQIDISNRIGYSGAAQLMMNLALMINDHGASLHSQDIMLIEYCDGAPRSEVVLSMLRCNSSSVCKASLQQIQESLRVKECFEGRDLWSPSKSSKIEEDRLSVQYGTSVHPSYDIHALAPGTYYLDSFDRNKVPCYIGKSMNTPRVPCDDFEPIKSEKSDSKALENSISSENGKYFDAIAEKPAVRSTSPRRRSESYVWASGRNNVEIVVTGVSAAVPGRNGSVFPKEGNALDNIHRIIDGENFITPLPQ